MAGAKPEIIMVRALFVARGKGRNTMKKKFGTKQLTTMAMLIALAYIVVVICHFVMPPIVEQPPLKLDLKDSIVVMAGFMLGPVPALIISVIVSVIEMLTISTTGPIGLIMNVLSTCAFACTASFIYKRLHTKNGAVISLLCGVVVMVIAMLLWNYIVTPMYQGVPREIVAKMLLPTFLPFNAIKGGVNMAITLLIYKPLSSALKKSGLLPADAAAKSAGKQKLSAGIYILGAVLLISCVLFALALAKVI